MEYKFTVPGRLEGLNNYTADASLIFYHDVSVDKENPRIEVTITELTAEQAKMKLRDLLKDLETG